MFWETISPESTLIQPRKTAYVWKALWNAWLVDGDDQHPSSPWKGTPVSNFVRLLDPRAQDSWCTGTASRRKCSLLCLLSCQKSLHEEKKVKEKKKNPADMFPMSCLKNILAFKNSFMIYLWDGVWGILNWMLILCLVLSALFVSNCCFQSARLCLSVSVLAKPFLPTRS